MKVSQKLPAGKYYIGDPCYVIDERWDEFLAPYWETDNGGVFDFSGREVCAFGTQYGDGAFPCSDGSVLGVDAGIIGAVPLDLCIGTPDVDGTVITFDEAFECYRESDGRMHFGDVSVMTGDEEDDNECPECGHECR
jgi:hypothetical protein